MQPRTWETVQEEIKKECDIEDEQFIKDSELMAAANGMIRAIEGDIIELNEDYLMKTHDFTLVDGQATYDLPSDLFAQKIKWILFSDGDCKSAIERGEPWQCVMADCNGKMFYEILNTAWNTGRDIKFWGLPDYKSSQTVTAWYIREITRISSINSYVNLPEFENLIILAVKKRIFEKEKNPLLALVIEEIKEEKLRMRKIIVNQAPDGLNIEPDLSFYNDFNGG